MFISNFPKIGILLQDCAWKILVFKYLSSNFNSAHKFGNKSALTPTVNYSQSSAFDRPYLSCYDRYDRWLFEEIFFLLTLFLFLRNPFERSGSCFPGI